MTSALICDPLINPRFTPAYTAAIRSAATANANAFRCENILVPINSLATALPALNCARWFVEQAGSKLSLFFAASPDTASLSPEELQSEVTRMAGIRRDRFRAVVVSRGCARVATITQAARAEAADLIVIPAHFFKEAGHFFYANPMEQLTRQAPCPLLVVGDNVPSRQPDAAVN